MVVQTVREADTFSLLGFQQQIIRCADAADITLISCILLLRMLKFLVYSRHQPGIHQQPDGFIAHIFNQLLLLGGEHGLIPFGANAQIAFTGIFITTGKRNHMFKIIILYPMASVQ
ncbi:hypothetical protein D3C73_756270 [compost metagenome]